MRILTVVHLYPPHHLGGYEVACKAVMDRFTERGHEILVLTGEHRLDAVEDRAEAPGMEMRRTLKAWWDWEADGPMSPGWRQRISIERHNQAELRRAVRDFRPDVASVWNLGFMSWSLPTLLERQGVPLVLTFGDDWICHAFLYDPWTHFFDVRPWARPLGRLAPLETRLPTFSGAEVAVASQMIGDSIERTSRWKFPQASLIRMGVETRDFPVVEPVRKAWSWQLLYAGRVVPQKGVPTLVRSLVHMPEARLAVDGPVSSQEQDRLSALATELGVEHRLHMTRSPRTELAGRYRAADVVVFPSEWEEPFGIVPLEAMACGVPVVATGTGGSGEFLHDGGNCLLFRAGDAAGLAAAVTHLAEDRALRSKIVAGGTATALEMNMDTYADRLENVHRAAAARGARQVMGGALPAPA